MQERRRDKRIDERKQVAITVLAAPEARELEGRTFFCPTEDLSVSGLRLKVHAAIPKGAALALRVAFASPLKAFRLIGRSAWSRDTDEGSLCEIGVEFRECPVKVLSEWSDTVSGLLQESPEA